MQRESGKSQQSRRQQIIKYLLIGIAVIVLMVAVIAFMTKEKAQSPPVVASPVASHPVITITESVISKS